MNAFVLGKKFLVICLPLLSLLTGCGKGFGKKVGPDQEVRRRSIEPSTVIKLANDNSLLQNYHLPQMGRVVVPGRLTFITGDRSAQTKVHFNTASAYEFYCVYGQVESHYSLLSCYDLDASPLNFASGDMIVHLEGDGIHMTDSAAKVKAEFEIEWH